MKKILLMAFLVACSHGAKESTNDMKKHIQVYKDSAAELVKLNKANGDKNEINKLSLDLIEKAKPIMLALKTKLPQCSELMDTVISKATLMTTLTLEEIEADYHDGAALPKSPEECYEGKELIIHPATVAILTSKKRLNKDHRTQIDDEIEEVIAHIDLL